MKSLLASTLRHAKDDKEVRFFGELLDQNITYFEASSITKGIQLLRKHYVDFTSKGDHSFKKVKVKIQELVKHLCAIFSSPRSPRTPREELR